MKNEEVTDCGKKAVFLQKILDELPVIAYVNEYRKPGDLKSLKVIWSSLYTQEFLGLTREDIDGMGFVFFESVFHPADVEFFNELSEKAVAGSLEKVFTSILRVKPFTGEDYIWLYGHSVILDYYKNGSPRHLLNVSFEINGYMHTKNQLTEALKEIGRLQHDLQCRSLTKREREVLCCISRGLTNKQISTKLFISESTAKTHRNNIIKKLKIKNSAALAALAGECGMN